MREHRSQQHGFGGQGTYPGEARNLESWEEQKYSLGDREHTKEARAHKRGLRSTAGHTQMGGLISREQPWLEGPPTSETLGHKGIAGSHMAILT